MMATPPSLPEITGMAVKLWDAHSALEKIAKHLGTLWLMARQEAGRHSVSAAVLRSAPYRHRALDT